MCITLIGQSGKRKVRVGEILREAERASNSGTHGTANRRSAKTGGGTGTNWKGEGVTAWPVGQRKAG